MQNLKENIVKSQNLIQTWKQNPDRLLPDKIEIENAAIEQIESLCEHLGLDLYNSGSRLTGPCPIHGGDNPKALCIYTDSGRWFCWTNHCEYEYYGITGFIKGVLNLPFQQTLEWIVDKLDEKAIIREKQERKIETKVDKSVLKNLVIPPQYYIDRGILPGILSEYGVGLALRGELKNRIIFPIHNLQGQYIGCTARTIREVNRFNPKWLHKDIKTSFHLYNAHQAQDHIRETKSVILVESTMNVLKLVQNGIKNVVATFGAHLTSQQSILLECLDAQRVYLLYDNDRAGQMAQNRIMSKKKFDYVVDFFDFCGYNDVGDMPDNIIRRNLCL